MKRVSTNRLLLAGGVCSAIGVLTLIGWVIGEPSLLRFQPDWLPMRFNAALGVTLAGAGLLFRARRRWVWERSAASLVLLLGAGTLAQYVLGLSFGIDELLVRDFLALEEADGSAYLPGRMPPTAAAGLLMLGLALLLRPKSVHLALLQALPAAALSSVGTAALVSYVAGGVFLYEWGGGMYPSLLSVGSAVSMLLAGWALLREASEADILQTGVPPAWIPLPVLLAGLVLTGLLGEGLGNQHRQATRSILDREVEAVQSILANRLQSRWQALTSLARESELGEGGQTSVSVAAGYYASNPGLLALEWVDLNSQVRWAYPLDVNEHMIGFDLGKDPVRRGALRQARETRSVAVTPTVELKQGGRGFLSCAPVFRGDRLVGYLVGVFRYQEFFERALRDVGSEYGLEIREQGVILYRSALEAAAPEWSRERPVALPGVTWTLRVWPTDEQLEQIASPLPDFAMFAGLALSLLMAMVVLYAQRAAQRAQEAEVGEERYRDLVENVRELICSHDETGRLTSVNHSIVQLFGYSREEMLGRSIADFLTPRARAEFPTYLARVLEKGRAQGFMEVALRRGGERILEYDNTRGRDQEGRTVIRGVSRDVTERVIIEQELAQLRRQQESILRSVQEGIYEVGLDGIARFVNPAAGRMLGYRPEEILGRNPHELFHHSRPDGTPYLIEECPAFLSLRDGEPRTTDRECFWRRDGSTLAVEYSASPVRDGQGRVRGTVVTFRDITERREVDRLKDEFISVVSHELRTPLTSIRGSLGLLTAGKLGMVDPQGQRMLEIALSNTERLVRLINDILDLERLTSGRAPLQLQDCSMSELLNTTVGAVQAVADAAKVHLRVEAPEGGALRADPDRIVQALTNLTGNAVKFSPEDTTVVLRARDEEPWMIVEVQDRGRGIPPEHQQRIFERFHQVDGSDSRQKGGTGLGLAITRTIVEQHGGRIELESTPGEGSLFRLMLPKAGPES